MDFHRIRKTLLHDRLQLLLPRNHDSILTLDRRSRSGELFNPANLMAN